MISNPSDVFDMNDETNDDELNEQWEPFSTGLRNQTYFISNLGTCKVVYSKSKRKRLLNQNFVAHRLVAEYFVDNPNGYSAVDYRDGNSLNNHATNLQLVKDAKQNASNPKTLEKQTVQHPILQIGKETHKVIK